jgi:hypothetical protein
MIECAKKNQSHRKDGVNIMALNGAQDSDMDNQGGWTGQHTSSKASKSVRQVNYMSVESNICAMTRQWNMDTQLYPAFDKFRKDPNRSKFFSTSGSPDVCPVPGIQHGGTAPLLTCRGRVVEESGSG